MVVYERNVDIGEIETGPDLGMPFLKGLSVRQKLVLWGCAGAAVVWVVASSFGAFGELPGAVIYGVMMGLIGVGVLFGTNYNSYISMWEYARAAFGELFGAFGANGVASEKGAKVGGRAVKMASLESMEAIRMELEAEDDNR